jgi:hypothetical protein
MSKIDDVILGDNQFFGINHMSQNLARDRGKQFENIENIFRVYDYAFEAGVKGVMLNSHKRATDICDRFRQQPNKYSNVNFYPSVPYPHKYASLVAEQGMFSAVKTVLFSSKESSALSKIKTGASAVLMKDAVAIMKMLVDLEMEAFQGLNVKVVFLQNIITDLLLGLDQGQFLAEYCKYISEKYNAKPGLITQNLPFLRSTLIELGVSNVVICASINKIGYLMSPNIESNVEIIQNNDPNEFEIMAMSTLASGAINPVEAYNFVNDLNIQSVVFGASSQKNIQSSVELIRSRS